VTRHVLRALWVALLLLSSPFAAHAQAELERLEAGRFTVLAYPSERTLARALLSEAQRADSFPGLPRPRAAVVIEVAPTDEVFRAWVGDAFPEWGAAAAFPGAQRIVMQGPRSGGSAAGDPLVVLRHELAHLALAEALGGLAPRWFDEGYASFAAGEWGREEIIATNVALVLRGPRTFAALETMFYGGGRSAEGAYALAHRAVAELAALDPARGLTLFFTYWVETQSLEKALRQAYGMTLAGFEEHWVSRTRLRYGALALAGDLAVAAGVMLVVLLPVYIQRRRRDRRRLEALRTSEADQERRARESALDALLPPAPPPKGQGLLDTPSDHP
jgi:hypothetical protein